jgi:hypothetical protein
MTRYQFAALFLLVMASVPSAWAGETPAATAAPEGRSLADLNTSPIQDNSLLIEEAYNQEDGVIQHISFFQLLSTGAWAFTQTEEWPLRTIKHQLSVTLAATHAEGYSGGGWGDTFINYRYQLIGSGETRLAISPRVSLLLPTGSASSDRGMGGAGVQVNLPLSFELNKHLVTHWNVGTTWVPRAQDQFHQRAASLGANLGQSVVWTASPRFNALVETVWLSSPQVAGPGVTTPDNNLFISPGIRWSHNFRNGLQIVPGVGVPIGVGPSSGQVGAIVYLSFEHGFRGAHSR